jgi:hypothetical protein
MWLKRSLVKRDAVHVLAEQCLGAILRCAEVDACATNYLMEFDPRILATVLLRGLNDLANLGGERTPSTLLGWVMATEDCFNLPEYEFCGLLLDSNVEPLVWSLKPSA